MNFANFEVCYQVKTYVVHLYIIICNLIFSISRLDFIPFSNLKYSTITLIFGLHHEVKLFGSLRKENPSGGLPQVEICRVKIVTCDSHMHVSDSSLRQFVAPYLK